MAALRGFLKAAERTPAIALWSALIFVTSILRITRKSSVRKCSSANRGEEGSEFQGSAASLANWELAFPLQNINYIWLCY